MLEFEEPPSTSMDLVSISNFWKVRYEFGPVDDHPSFVITADGYCPPFRKFKILAIPFAVSPKSPISVHTRIHGSEKTKIVGVEKDNQDWKDDEAVRSKT